MASPSSFDLGITSTTSPVPLSEERASAASVPPPLFQHLPRLMFDRSAKEGSGAASVPLPLPEGSPIPMCGGRPLGMLAVAAEEEETIAGIATIELNDDEPAGPAEPERGRVLARVLNEEERRKLFAYLDQNGYELGGMLGEGQSGIVFRLEGEGRGNVLKIFRNDPEIPASTVVDPIRGAHLITDLEHDAIVSPKCALVVHEGGIQHVLTEGNKIIGYIYPFIPGADLSKIIQDGNLTERQICQYGAQIGQALHVVHRHGIYHRDLKPGNVRIPHIGGAKLMDFDLARRISPSISPKGTKAFRAPEASTPGGYSTQSEAWSLGVMLYQMVSGRLPFKNEWDAALDSEVVLPDGTHPELQTVIQGLLRKTPSQRMRLEEAVARLERFSP